MQRARYSVYVDSSPVTVASLPATLPLAEVELTVADLDRAVGFYQDALGLQLHRREDPVAALGVGGAHLVVLVEQPGARPAGRPARPYHYAVLSPADAELPR